MKRTLIIIALLWATAAGAGENMNEPIAEMDWPGLSSMTTYQPAHTMTFGAETEQGYKEVGSLSWKGGVLTFTGDADASARVFFNYIRAYFEDECKCEGKPTP